MSCDDSSGDNLNADGVECISECETDERMERLARSFPFSAWKAVAWSAPKVQGEKHFPSTYDCIDQVIIHTWQSVDGKLEVVYLYEWDNLPDGAAPSFPVETIASGNFRFTIYNVPYDDYFGRILSIENRTWHPEIYCKDWYFLNSDGSTVADIPTGADLPIETLFDAMEAMLYDFLLNKQ
jgi:hypothetical protein